MKFSNDFFYISLNCSEFYWLEGGSLSVVNVTWHSFHFLLYMKVYSRNMPGVFFLSNSSVSPFHSLVISYNLMGSCGFVLFVVCSVFCLGRKSAA